MKVAEGSKHPEVLKVEHLQYVDIAVLGAVSLEIAPLLSCMESVVPFVAGPAKGFTGLAGEYKILVGSTGLGKVNAAITATAILSRFTIGELWNLGCAGAYTGMGLNVGDVLISDASLLGDEGVLTGSQVRKLGIPTLSIYGADWYDRIPIELQEGFRATCSMLPPGQYRLTDPPLRKIMRFNGTGAVPPDPGGQSMSGFQVVYGPSVTVGMSSGDAATARTRCLTTGALAENMEGSAIAHASLVHETLFMECRGISNPAGDRDHSRWNIEEAIENSTGVLLGRIFGL